MDKATKTFGNYVKQKRLEHTPKYTLKKMSEALGINLTQLSDIENGRKKPFDKDKIELFCSILALSDSEKAELYDLQARDSECVPADIADTIMYTEEGDYARAALRMVNQGKGSIELWKDLIRKMEEDS